ncbi:MAG TPA: AI-2E family transporter [Alphaproteobacteria bacterium]|nr:AI-2E family transporter [Alphaproteobacteria bacterium]
MNATRPMRFWLIGLLVFGLAVWLLSEVLMPFAAAMAVAYLLDPLADRLERAGAPRWLATTLVLLAFFVVAIGLIVLLVPVIQAQIARFIEALPAYRESLQEIFQPLVDELRDTIAAQDLQEIQSTIGGYAGEAASWAASVIGGLWRGGLAIIDIVSLLVITPVVAFYLLRDWDHMVANVDGLLPRPHVDEIRSLARQADQTLASFVRGQGTVCLILGTYYALALGLVGLDFGIIVGMGAGLLSFIPYVGTITGFIVSMIIALVQFDNWAMWALVAGLFIAGQVVEGNFLTPKLVGESVGLHPVWVMFALLAGGSLFGFTGILLAVPVAAVMGVLVRFFLGKYLSSPYFRGTKNAEAAEGQAEDAAS